MTNHARMLAFLAILFVAAIGGLLQKRLFSQTGPTIQITSPLANSVFTPGQSVSVSIQPGSGTVLQQVTAWFNPPTSVSPVVTTAPYTLSLSAPTGVVGLVTLTGAAIDSQGNRLQASVQVIIMTPSLPQTITVDPTSMMLSQAGDARTIAVAGILAGGTILDISSDSRVSYVSSNTRVATIIGTGGVQAIAPGIATITVTFNGGSGSILTASIPVAVNVFEQRGDLDGDGDVDQDDLNLLLKAINAFSTGSGDPRDLNGDGKIDALDARILTNLCSRPRCTNK